MWGLTQLPNFREANGLRGALSESLLRVCSHNRKMVLGKNLFQTTKCGFGKDPSNPMQLFGEKEDSLVWKFSQNGEFSTASAYDLARLEDTNPHPFSGYWLWKFDTIQKIKHFIWLCYHNSIPVRQVIATRGISCNTTCPLCQSQEESIVHSLRHCPFALKFWKQLGTPQSLTNFLQLSLLNWIKQNCLCSNQVLINGFSWNAQFPFVI